MTLTSSLENTVDWERITEKINQLRKEENGKLVIDHWSVLIMK